MSARPEPEAIGRAAPVPGESRAAEALPAALAALAAAPHRFGLFAALRLIEAAHPDRPRLGEARRARDEPARLGQPPHLRFPPAELAGFAGPGPGRPLRLSTYAFGLFGPQGPLPLHATREAFARARHRGDPTLADFCDVFHHRLIALFWRAHAAARPAIEADRPGRGRWRRRTGALAGLAGPAFDDRAALPDDFARHAAGLLALQTRPAEGVARAVALFFGVPVRVVEFVGAWLDIPAGARTRLGRPDGASRLGVEAVAGARVFLRHHRFRLVLGPLGYDDFRLFLPVGDALPRLRALVRHAAGLQLDWDVRLVLRRDEVPAARLGADGARLGWTSWLAADGGRRRDADDLVLLVGGGG